MPSVARTVPSLARTLPGLTRTVLSHVRTVPRLAFLQPRGTRRQRQLVLTDGMGWDGMDGSVHFFFWLIS